MEYTLLQKKGNFKKSSFETECMWIGPWAIFAQYVDRAFEAYFPPQPNLENTKNPLDVEGPHHYNIFSESVP